MTEIRPLRAYAEVALGRQRSPAHDTGPHMVPYLRAANVKDGTLDLTDVKEMNFTPPEQKLFSLRPGDVLVTEGSGSLGSVGASAVWSGDIPGTVCFQNTLLRLRPRPLTDGRFLAWWCRHAFADGVFASISTGANIFHVSAERVRSLPVTYLPLAAQRAIADYLDNETARIDALMVKKKRMIELLNDWEQAAGLAALGDFRQGHTRTLRQYGATVLTGPFGTVLSASEYVDGGVPLINPTHIRRGRLVPESSVSVPDTVVARIARHKLCAGDIVMGRKGDVGRCAIVSTDAEGWICGSDSIAIRPDRNRLQPAYLAAVLQLDIYRQQLQRGSTGAMVASVNEGTLLNLRLPALGLHEQDRAAEVWARNLGMREAVATRLEQQLSLIREHRHALITAAVTGELDVPGAAA